MNPQKELLWGLWVSVFRCFLHGGFWILYGSYWIFQGCPLDHVCTCMAWDMSRQPAEFIFFGRFGALGFRILSSSVAGHEE